ncbi:MAG: hypothetical protein ACI9WU_001162, partial [Myxococcota bacterium]
MPAEETTGAGASGSSTSRCVAHAYTPSQREEALELELVAHRPD